MVGCTIRKSRGASIYGSVNNKSVGVYSTVFTLGGSLAGGTGAILLLELLQTSVVRYVAPLESVPNVTSFTALRVPTVTPLKRHTHRL